MTGANFASYIRLLTKTDSTTFTDARVVLLANIEKDDLAQYITEQCGEDYFQIEYYRDLVADQREYTLPSDILVNLKQVAAMLDGSTWKVLNERDKNQVRLPLITEANVTTAYSGLEPEYDLLDMGIRILSEEAVVSVTDGIRLDTMVYPDNIDTGTLALTTDLSIPTTDTATAMPRASHKVWALKTSIAYKQSRPKMIPLTVEEKNIEFYVERMITELRGRNLDRSTIPLENPDNGDYGFEY